MSETIDNFLLNLKNRRMAAMLAPLIVGSFAGWVLVVKPGLFRIAAAKAELSNLSQKETSFGQIASSEQKLGLYKAKLSKEGGKTWLIEELNTLAEGSKFSILSITPDEKVTVVGGYLNRISVRIEAEATYHQLGEFVSRVENLDPFVKISTVDIDGTGAGGLGGGTAGLEGSRPKGNASKILLSVSLFSLVPGAL